MNCIFVPRWCKKQQVLTEINVNKNPIAKWGVPQKLDKN